jgi:hypothetical protein
MKTALACALIGLFTLRPLYQEVGLRQGNPVHSIGTAVKIRLLEPVFEYVLKALGQAANAFQAGYFDFVLIFTVIDFTRFYPGSNFVLDLQLSGNHRQRLKNFIRHFSPPASGIVPLKRNMVWQADYSTSGRAFLRTAPAGEYSGVILKEKSMEKMDLREMLREFGRIITDINEELTADNLAFHPEIKIIVKDPAWNKMLTDQAIRGALFDFREELEKKGVL